VGFGHRFSTSASFLNLMQFNATLSGLPKTPHVAEWRLNKSAEALNIETGSELLDIGCGLGGPARFLAATYGCRVTGIDLSQPFVDVATMLPERCGLKEKQFFIKRTL
jgi:2-polyprenyl-3-methyl-5-hydroxy-6-metoxy-1,4-benzoquinol methylase